MKDLLTRNTEKILKYALDYADTETFVAFITFGEIEHNLHISEQWLIDNFDAILDKATEYECLNEYEYPPDFNDVEDKVFSFNFYGDYIPEEVIPLSKVRLDYQYGAEK